MRREPRSTLAPSISARCAFSGTPARRHVAPQRIEQARHTFEKPQVAHQADGGALDQLVVRVRREGDGLGQRRQRDAIHGIESERAQVVEKRAPLFEGQAGNGEQFMPRRPVLGGTTSAATSRSRECTLITWLSSSSSCRWVPAPSAWPETAPRFSRAPRSASACRTRAKRRPRCSSGACFVARFLAWSM